MRKVKIELVFEFESDEKMLDLKTVGEPQALVDGKPYIYPNEQDENGKDLLQKNKELENETELTVFSHCAADIALRYALDGLTNYFVAMTTKASLTKMLKDMLPPDTDFEIHALTPEQFKDKMESLIGKASPSETPAAADDSSKDGDYGKLV